MQNYCAHFRYKFRSSHYFLWLGNVLKTLLEAQRSQNHWTYDHCKSNEGVHGAKHTTPATFSLDDGMPHHSSSKATCSGTRKLVLVVRVFTKTMLYKCDWLILGYMIETQSPAFLCKAPVVPSHGWLFLACLMSILRSVFYGTTASCRETLQSVRKFQGFWNRLLQELVKNKYLPNY